MPLSEDFISVSRTRRTYVESERVVLWATEGVTESSRTVCRNFICDNWLALAAYANRGFRARGRSLVGVPWQGIQDWAVTPVGAPPFYVLVRTFTMRPEVGGLEKSRAERWCWELATLYDPEKDIGVVVVMPGSEPHQLILAAARLEPSPPIAALRTSN